MWDDFVTDEMAAETVRAHGGNPGNPDELVALLTPEHPATVLSAALGFLVQSPAPVALEAAKTLLLHENSTVRRQSLSLLAALLGQEGLPWYIQCCKARECRGTTDHDAWEFVLLHGDESAVPLVAGWVAKQIGKGKLTRTDPDGQSPRTRALIFLACHSEKQQAQAVFAKAEEHWACFSLEEAGWLSEQVPYFQRTPLSKPPVQSPGPVGHPVFAACERGDLSVVRAYLDQGGSVYSCENHGINPAAPRRPNLGRSLAMLAVQANQGDVLKLLLERGLDVNRPPMIFDVHLLDLAMEKEHSEMVNLLIDSGASFQFSSPRRASLFWTACKKGTDVAVVEKMIRLGAAVDESHYDGSTPLMNAATAGNISLMSALVNGGANLEANNLDHETALIQAIRAKRVEATAWLLDHGSNIEAQGHRKRTPIMYALETHDAELIALLLARGANLKAKDNQNRTVIALARDFHGGEVWQLVRSAIPDGDKQRSQPG